MTRTFAAQMQYFIEYYRKMNWKMTPQDILEMCAEEVDFYDNDTWNFLMDARNYLNNQKRAEWAA